MVCILVLVVHCSGGGALWWWLGGWCIVRAAMYCGLDGDLWLLPCTAIPTLLVIQGYERVCDFTYTLLGLLGSYAKSYRGGRGCTILRTNPTPLGRL